MKTERDDLRIVALDYAWRTANQVNAEGTKPAYTKGDVLAIARDYLTFLKGEEKQAA
jgi:hypothetical protein